jgi:hypothetical protein
MHFSVEQGRTKVSGEAHLSTPQPDNLLRTPLSGKRASSEWARIDMVVEIIIVAEHPIITF